MGQDRRVPRISESICALEDNLTASSCVNPGSSMPEDRNIYLPNNGQTRHIRRPVDVDHLYRDPDKDLPVLLVATRAPRSPLSTNTSRDTHWKLAWGVGINTVGIPVERQIHVVRDLDHLINWGPLTKLSEGHTKAVTVTTMSLEQRRQLESIASATPVRKPDGAWNSQDWLRTVLEASVQQGLITQNECRTALAAICDV
ncbi:hypothetical protein LshimejAT787_1005680 [Lyophyllum shimeji]|uniref:Uncharacterized protein n=1 Tax=Lyophyllum shimeji TaxID=47721 RepID=A0A9P3PTY1_LYOSH|nr:hypothetical protein LshimejAT787_1005680 [Lyophyllum shimeji]